MEGLVIGRRVCCAEAEPLGCRRHCHQAGDGVHLHATNAVFHRFRMVSAIHVRHCQPVVKEADIEFAFL